MDFGVIDAIFTMINVTQKKNGRGFSFRVEVEGNAEIPIPVAVSIEICNPRTSQRAYQVIDLH